MKAPTLLLAALAATAAANLRANDIKPLLTAKNPNPKALPTLGVVRRGRQVLVSATFPDIPGLTCDAWCYESPLDYLGARDLGKGVLELRHRVREHPQAVLVTVVKPEPGVVEVVARMTLDKGKAGGLPANLPAPNICWQLTRAPAFASKPDPYPRFIKRCFIFTPAGRTFLDKTTRRKIPPRRPDDPYNNPPWVQMYVGTWQAVPKVGPTSWADYSPDRYVATVIGAVSRDAKYLVAVANDSAPLMAQAWHDCLHNNAEWLPADVPADRRTWRVKLYALPNDPAALLRRCSRDFPGIKRQRQGPNAKPAGAK